MTPEHFAGLPAPRVRFAPSPTGHMHIGNIRPALINWLFARAHGGSFLLRFDDTDTARSRPELAASIAADLRWLGLDWDGSFRQTDRLAAYAAAADRLRAAGRLYPAYETPDELERRRKRQAALGRPPVYDRAALRLTETERAALAGAGRVPHWRFRLESGSAAWDDLIRGAQAIETGTVSDPVIQREDGSFLYTFTSVVDDIASGITHVIRGEDHVTNTAAQLQLFAALSAAPPAFAHHNLLVDAAGGKLSKRLGSLTIAGFRADGLEPMAVMALSAALGTPNPPAPHRAMTDLIAGFDIAKLSRAPARFDAADLRQLNARLLLDTPYDAVAERLAPLLLPDPPAFWHAVRGNLTTFCDVETWCRVVNGPLAAQAGDAAFAATAARLLPTAIDAAAWRTWTLALGEATGRKGRALFLPLRIALTGLDHGPEMARLLPLIGRDESLRRLARVSGEAATAQGD